MQEATLDAAATMVDACSSPALQPPWQLIAAGLDLVARATGGPLDASSLTTQQQPAANAGNGAAWPADRPPPVGVVELALKLWRGCLSAMRPPLQSELSHANGPRRTDTVGCGAGGRAAKTDNAPARLVRPADRTLNACALRFAPECLSPTFSQTFEAAMDPSAGGQRRGALAAIGTMHTILLSYPEHAPSCLQPALIAGLTAIVAPEDGPDAPTELLLTNIAGILGRTLLCSQELFSSVVQQTGALLQLPDCHLYFAQRWVNLIDSILLLGAAPARRPLPRHPTVDRCEAVTSHS